MKISYNWLRSYIDTDLSPEHISEILTDTGLEVEKLEAFETVPGGLKGVVVGEIIKLSGRIPMRINSILRKSIWEMTVLCRLSVVRQMRLKAKKYWWQK